MTQLTLVRELARAQVREAARLAQEGTIQERFETFHGENPQVYELLVTFARQMKERGHKRVGIELIWARMRWEVMMTTVGDPFKLNDHFTSRYARLIMRQEPDLEGFFPTRKLRSA